MAGRCVTLLLLLTLEPSHNVPFLTALMILLLLLLKLALASPVSKGGRQKQPPTPSHSSCKYAWPHLDWGLDSVTLVASDGPVHEEEVQLLNLQLPQHLLNCWPDRIRRMVPVVQLWEHSTQCQVLRFLKGAEAGSPNCHTAGRNPSSYHFSEWVLEKSSCSYCWSAEPLLSTCINACCNLRKMFTDLPRKLSAPCDLFSESSVIDSDLR